MTKEDRLLAEQKRVDDEVLRTASLFFDITRTAVDDLYRACLKRREFAKQYGKRTVMLEVEISPGDQIVTVTVSNDGRNTHAVPILKVIP